MRIESKITFDALILISKQIVNRFVYNSVIPERERNDVEMSIIEKYLKKQSKIDTAFCGKCKVETYYSAVFNKMCLEIIRKEQKHWNLNSLQNETDYNHQEASTMMYETKKKLLITNEIQFLKNTLAKFKDERHKINLFLKFYFDAPISANDINNYCKKWDNCEIRAKGTCIFLQRDNCLSKAEIFEKLNFAVNNLENKNSNKDATRMWMRMKLNQIIKQMNENCDSKHSAESISLLFELS